MALHPPHDLNRYEWAQQGTFPAALAEIRAGRKRSHWMWFIFPQLAGPGHSPTARHYAIRDLAEARAYLAHPVLGPRLLLCAEAVLEVETGTARQLFGHPDDLKPRSCATLFSRVSPAGSVFQRVLDRYFARSLSGFPRGAPGPILALGQARRSVVWSFQMSEPQQRPGPKATPALRVGRLGGWPQRAPRGKSDRLPASPMPKPCGVWTRDRPEAVPVELPGVSVLNGIVILENRTVHEAFNSRMREAKAPSWRSPRGAGILPTE